VRHRRGGRQKKWSIPPRPPHGFWGALHQFLAASNPKNAGRSTIRVLFISSMAHEEWAHTATLGTPTRSFLVLFRNPVENPALSFLKDNKRKEHTLFCFLN